MDDAGGTRGHDALRWRGSFVGIRQLPNCGPHRRTQTGTIEQEFGVIQTKAPIAFTSNRAPSGRHGIRTCDLHRVKMAL